MRLPLPARIGIYLILSGFILDFILYFRGWYESAVPETGTFSIFFFVPGIVLLLGTGIFWLIEQWRLRRPQVPLTSPGMQSKPLDLGNEPVAFDPQKLRSLRSTSQFSIAIGIVLIVFGILLPLGYRRWLATRTFVPFNMPVSLAVGQIRTGDFYINLHQWYYINIETDRSRPVANCRPEGAPKIFATLYRDGQKLGEVRNSDYSYVNYFYVDKTGNYSLDIEILSDASCLNALRPKLIVRTYDYDYIDWKFYIQWISLGLVLAGTGLIFYSARIQISNRISRRTTEAAYESITRAYYPRVSKPLRKKFSGMPSFGLVGALGLTWLISFYMFLAPLPYRGLPVYLIKPPTKNIGLRIEPIVVHVEDAGVNVVPHVYVNSKQVEWSQLRAELRTQLGRRPEWVVYVEGDSNLPFAAVATAISDARSLQAKVVLLTPQTEFKPPIQ